MPSLPSMHFHFWNVMYLVACVASWIMWFFARERVRRRRLDMSPQARERAKLTLYLGLAGNIATIGVTIYLLLQP